MREILFRGKRIDGSGWVEGDLEQDRQSKRCWVIPPYCNEEEVVDPATVGQFTGLLDKNGQRIFEGDIVKIVYSEDGEMLNEIREVRDTGKGMGYSPLNWAELCDACDHCVEIISIVVIGNIHDNPELLGGAE